MTIASRFFFAVAASGLLSPALALAQPAQGAAAKGAAVFEDRCSGCHSLDGPGEGPSLAGVVGRKAGSLPGYDYTAAMKASGLTWTAATLDRFLADPQALVPGTAMQASVPDQADRGALIAYLATLSPHR
ncbi:MAG: c-type cytochrome [Caulobacteraceae bacterium]